MDEDYIESPEEQESRQEAYKAWLAVKQTTYRQDARMVSNCCQAPPLGGLIEVGMCSRCKDHCDFEPENDE